MTAKILANCLSNYSDSALVRFDAGVGKPSRILTMKHRQVADTVNELFRDMECYDPHARLVFTKGNDFFAMRKLEQRGVYLMVVADKVDENACNGMEVVHVAD